MPVYCYTNDTIGITIERVFALGKAPEIVRFTGRRYRRNPVADHQKFKNTPGNWPKECMASGVHPKQIPEAMEALRKRGVPTEFTPEGNAIYTSREHRARALQAIGMFDRDGGYGDAQHTGTADQRELDSDYQEPKIPWDF